VFNIHTTCIAFYASHCKYSTAIVTEKTCIPETSKQISQFMCEAKKHSAEHYAYKNCKDTEIYD